MLNPYRNIQRISVSQILSCIEATFRRYNLIISLNIKQKINKELRQKQTELMFNQK